MADVQVTCETCRSTGRVESAPDHRWCCSKECYEALYAYVEAGLRISRQRHELLAERRQELRRR